MLIGKGTQQITDDWLKEIDNNKIVGAVMLDFSEAFDIIDHHLLWKNVCVMDLRPLSYHGLRAICLIEHRVFSLMEASVM